MGAENKASATTALPMLLPVWGFNSNEQTENDISKNDAQGDLTNLIGINNPVLKYNAIRFLKPKYGVINKAYLTLDIQFPTPSKTDSTGIWLGRGIFAGGGELSDRVTDYILDEARIKDDHRRITGSANSINREPAEKRLIINRLDITPLIAGAQGNLPLLTNQNRAYAFILVIMFNGSAPFYDSSDLVPYHLWDCRVEASALLEV